MDFLLKPGPGMIDPEIDIEPWQDMDAMRARRSPLPQ